MNKELITKLLNDKLQAKLAEKKVEMAKKVIKESVELQEDHFSEDELDRILSKFEKNMNNDGIKAVEDYISAEADGNKGKASAAAGRIKRLMKESKPLDESAQQIADTIRKQLGGNKFEVMTGAKNFSFSKDGSLSFKFPKGKDGINHVSIKLDADDTYTMTFTKIRGMDAKEVAKESGIYNTDLRKVFTKITGLHTSLSESETLEEGMPLKGHAYHRKSDDELHYIIKDAGEAAKAMKGHDPKAEAKYLDQVNDASTVLHYRKNGGKRLNEAATEPKDIFVNFLKRDGWTPEQAEMEWGFVNGKSKDEYIRTTRTGATKTINRQDKLSVYMSYENAKNHSSYKD